MQGQNSTSFRLFLLIMCGLFGYSIYSKLELPAGYQFNFLLPINSLVPGKCTNLSVEIPRGFRALAQPENATIHEFIPVTDKNEQAWSRIITTQAFIGRGITASYLVEMGGKRLMQEPDAKIIYESAHDCGSYTTATMIISYLNTKLDRQEIAFLRYYSGPYDCSGFQYTIAVTAHKTEESVVQELKDFADKRTSLIKF